MQKALADEHVIGPLIAALRKRGLDVATVIDLGLKSEDDSFCWPARWPINVGC